MNEPSKNFKPKSSLSMMDHQHLRSFLVQWQTLVTTTSRSFWRELDHHSGWNVSMIAPDAFREGGMQDLKCAPNDPRNPPLVVLPVKKWHTQAVLFKGLTSTLLRWLNAYPNQKIYLCFTEPYALTALFSWVSLQIAHFLNLYKSKRPLLLFYGFQNIYKQFSPPLLILQKVMFKLCDGIIVAGSEHEEVLRRHGYQGRCLKLPMWFDREVFYPIKGTRNNSKIRISYAGSLLPEKGIQQVLQHIVKHPSVLKDCVIEVAGGGVLTSEIKELIARLTALNVEAKFLGPLDSSVMAEFYRSLDILIVPSRTANHWKEQFGRVIIEAMACGCVVIGSDSGEIPVVINDPKYIFREDDLEHFLEVFSNTIASFRNNKNDIRANIAESAYQRYADVNVAKNFANDLNRTFEEIGRP